MRSLSEALTNVESNTELNSERVLEKKLENAKKLRKRCDCKFETFKKDYKFCPLCGNKLTELEEDMTIKAERKPCKVLNDEFADPTRIYYGKISPMDNTRVFIYTDKSSTHFILGCHISKVKFIDEQRMEKCTFRKDDECGHYSTCSICSVF